MTLVQFFRIFNRNLNLFLLSAIVMAIVAYLLTRNAPSTYESKTEIFTGIASGVNLESVNSSKVDYFTTSNAYDNLINIIKSRRTLEEVGYRLLYQHMLLDSADPRIISKTNYGHFRYKMPKELEDSLLVEDDKEATLENIRQYHKENVMDQKVRLTFEYGGSPYSYESLKSISVDRVQNSDLLQISYSFNDPGIAQNTLEILNKVFTARMSEIKVGQSMDVIEYFREKVDEASKELAAAENQLKEFKVRNKIINYEHQTKSISVEKEQLEDEYQKEKAEKESAEAALEKLNRQLKLNKVMIKFGSSILQKRKKLADMKTKIAQLEVYYNQPEVLAELRAEAEKLEAELTEDMLTRYEFSRTKEGIKKETLLNEWLDYTLQLDKSKARLKIFEKRQEYFKNVYSEFAPLGSEIGRLKRKINVAEKNYLELQNSLNQALLRQRSEKLSSGGAVVTVPPYYPTSPKPSKTTLLILVAAVVGFMVPFVLVVLIEFLDSTVRTPIRGEELTGLKIMGALPNYRKRLANRSVDFDWLHNKALGIMAQNLRLEARQRKVELTKPKYTLVFSTRPEDGKFTATHHLANQMVNLNMRVLVVAPKELLAEHKPYYDFEQYQADTDFINSHNISDVIDGKYDTRLYDYVFFVFNPIMTEPYPLDLLKHFHIAICVVGAYRSWNRADNFALKEFSETLGYEPRVLVNGVDPDEMNLVVGEISKSRSAIRRFFKGILTLEFKTGKIRNKRKRRSN